MKLFISYLLLAITWSYSDAAAQRGRPLPSQENISADLRSADIQTLVAATSHAARIPVEEWSPALRDAILYALENEIRRDLEARQEGRQRWFDEPLRWHLTDLAVSMQDPVAIPLLTLTTGDLVSVRSVLAAFGRQALPHLLHVARGQGDTEARNVKGCLIALYEMVQQWGLEYFTTQERTQLKLVAALYLAPSTSEIRTDWDSVARGAALRNAAILALLLEDAEARMWVERLIADPESFPDKEAAKYAMESERRFHYSPKSPLAPDVTPLGNFIEAFDKRHQ